MGFLRKLVCLFRGHMWEARGWEEFVPWHKHCFEMSCRRCPESVKLEITPSSDFGKPLRWTVTR